MQGHRGSRGLMPENSLAAFEKALELGVNTLELDLAVSKDSQLVVSHEPWFSATICYDSLRNMIDESAEKNYNIHQHNYAQILKYDCGSKGNSRFPEQQKKAQVKPLLKEVIALAEKYTSSKNLPPIEYNIEIKTNIAGDGIYHPSPAVFSDLLHQFLIQNLPAERVVVQSFDLRVLQYWHKNYPAFRLAFLVGNKDNYEENLKSLGFNPAIYSPAYQLLDAQKIAALQEEGMKVIPWTVNEVTAMQNLLAWGVDGIITDYPDRALQFRPNN
ncbi:MAG: glycerophosphodiester phosphodiesterase family protein [Bacteroidota bacterium]